jgi:hypothetical protein
MSDDTTEALETARAAYEKATEALRLAQAAADRDHLTVKRIDVVEDDGTLRMVIGNSTHARDLPMRGRLVRHPGRRPAAGIIFVDDEGTECGGLQFGGGRSADCIDHGGYFTFDDYEQNESFRFGQSQDESGSRKWLEFVDRPAWSLADMIEELEHAEPAEAATVQERYGAEGFGTSRLRLFRDPDGSVGLVLRDGAGHDRLRLVVPAEGDVVAEVLDADGIPRSL